MPLLNEGPVLDGQAVLAHLVTAWTDVPHITDIEVKDAVTVAQIPGGALGLLHVATPVPSSDLEGPIKLAYHWPSAATDVGNHRQHVVVHVGSTVLDPVEVHLLLSKAVASILSTRGGIGVYIGNAMLVRSAADYASDIQSASRTALPILSWIGCNPVREGSMLSVYSTGLFQFGVRELEVRRSIKPAAELLGMMADLAHYQLATGNRLNDGDTFGETMVDRTRVRYEASEFIPDMEVAVVELNEGEA